MVNCPNLSRNVVIANDITSHRFSWKYIPRDLQWNYNTPGIEYNMDADWKMISRSRPLTAKFIAEYVHKLDWKILCRRKLPEQTYQKYLCYISPSDLIDHVSYRFIARNYSYFSYCIHYLGEGFDSIVVDREWRDIVKVFKGETIIRMSDDVVHYHDHYFRAFKVAMANGQYLMNAVMNYWNIVYIIHV